MSLHVCMGGGCKDKHAKKVKARLKELVRQRGLEDQLKVKSADCMGVCGKGPVVKVKPVKRVFFRIKPKMVSSILDEIEKALHSL